MQRMQAFHGLSRLSSSSGIQRSTFMRTQSVAKYARPASTATPAAVAPPADDASPASIPPLTIVPTYRKLNPNRSFFPSQILMSAIIQHGRMNRNQLWDLTKHHGIKSRAHMNKMLRWLVDQRRIMVDQPIKNKMKNQPVAISEEAKKSADPLQWEFWTYRLSRPEKLFRTRMQKRLEEKQQQEELQSTQGEGTPVSV